MPFLCALKFDIWWGWGEAEMGSSFEYVCLKSYNMFLSLDGRSCEVTLQKVEGGRYLVVVVVFYYR